MMTTVSPATFFTAANTQPAIPLHLIETAQFPEWLHTQSAFVQHWLSSVGFTAAPDTFWLVPDAQGQLTQAVAGVKSRDDFWAAGSLAKALPAGCYQLQDLNPTQAFNVCCAWGLGAYQFTAYKAPSKTYKAQLVWPLDVDAEEVMTLLEALYWVRDLINTPTEDLGPLELVQACERLTTSYGATLRVIEGEALLQENYPAIYAVGRASTQAPRLIDLRWGDATHPKITLVGKGVCFDSGGLNIKPSQAMGLMKKDMGGAAHALGLAMLMMRTQLKVCLRVLIPAVENAISGNAYRPGDVIATRKGLTVEITNTDAEGRLILADALTEAVREQPDLLLDFSTLTGAARIALGTEIPVLFTPNALMAQTLQAVSLQTQDLIWPLPLYEPYKKMLESPIADLNNAPTSSYAGAITAALFLQAFVPQHIKWMHFDLMAWNLTTKPGRPEGGEAMGLRAVWQYVREGLYITV